MLSNVRQNRGIPLQTQGPTANCIKYIQTAGQAIKYIHKMGKKWMYVQQFHKCSADALKVLSCSPQNILYAGYVKDKGYEIKQKDTRLAWRVNKCPWRKTCTIYKNI